MKLNHFGINITTILILISLFTFASTQPPTFEAPCSSIYGSDAIVMTETVVGVTEKVGFVDIVYNFTNIHISNTTANTTYTPKIDWLLIPIPWCFETIYVLSPCTLLYAGTRVSSSCISGGLTTDQGPNNQYVGYFMAIFDSTDTGCNAATREILAFRLSNVFIQSSPGIYDAGQHIDNDLQTSSPSQILSSTPDCNQCDMNWLECRDVDGSTILTRPLNPIRYNPNYLYGPICYDPNINSYIWKLENLENTFNVVYNAKFFDGVTLVGNQTGILSNFSMAFIISGTTTRDHTSRLSFAGDILDPSQFDMEENLPDCECGTLVVCDINGNINYTQQPRDALKVISSPTNQPPLSNPGVDQTIDLNQGGALLYGDGSYDPDLYPGVNGVAGNLAYFWSFVNGPVFVAINNSNEAIASFNTTVEGVYIFNLMVFDGQSFNVNSPTIVRVTLINIAPVVNLGQYPFNPVFLGNTVILNATGLVFDPDNSPAPLQLSWQLLSGPDIPGGIQNSDQFVASFVPNVTGWYLMRLYAYDGSKTSIGIYTVQVVDQTSQAITTTPTDSPTITPTVNPTTAAHITFPPSIPSPTFQPPTLQPTDANIPTSLNTNNPTNQSTPISQQPPTSSPTQGGNQPFINAFYGSNNTVGLVLGITLILGLVLLICMIFCLMPCGSPRTGPRSNKYSNNKYM
jgi:hypothetical protein